MIRFHNYVPPQKATSDWKGQLEAMIYNMAVSSATQEDRPGWGMAMNVIAGAFSYKGDFGTSLVMCLGDDGFVYRTVSWYENGQRRVVRGLEALLHGATGSYRPHMGDYTHPFLLLMQLADKLQGMVLENLGNPGITQPLVWAKNGLIQIARPMCKHTQTDYGGHEHGTGESWRVCRACGAEIWLGEELQGEEYETYAALNESDYLLGAEYVAERVPLWARPA